VELLAELGRRRIPINYGVEELRKDVAVSGVRAPKKIIW
jgi:predicted HTH domain antitoxin